MLDEPARVEEQKKRVVGDDSVEPEDKTVNYYYYRSDIIELAQESAPGRNSFRPLPTFPSPSTSLAGRPAYTRPARPCGS